MLFCGISLFAQKFQIPKLQFGCELKVTNEEIKTLGITQHGTRRILPITGGWSKKLNKEGRNIPVVPREK